LKESVVTRTASVFMVIPAPSTLELGRNMSEPFCRHHDKEVEREDGYHVLPCKLHHKVCGFKIAGAHHCQDVALIPYKFDFPEDEDCEGDCKL